MRQPLVITSLEEDLAEIGLSDTIQPKTESAAPEAVTTAPAEEPKVDAPAEVDEAKRVRQQVRVVGGKAKRVRTKRTSMAKKLANRAFYRKKKNVLKRKRGKASFQRRAARRDKIRGRLKHEGTEFQAKVAGLLESVETTLSQLQSEPSAEKTESLKGFANLAIIAEMLAEAFIAFTDDEDIELTKFEEIALREMAATYAQVAEECADIAEALDAGTIAEGEDDLKDAFNAHVQSVIEGLDAYSDLTEEEDDEGDDDDEDEDCEDCGESDCECDEGK